MYGDLRKPLDHLQRQTHRHQEPRGDPGGAGGCSSAATSWCGTSRPTYDQDEIKTLERYMCSRFFIDFPDILEQQRKLETYLQNHFAEEERSRVRLPHDPAQGGQRRHRVPHGAMGDRP